MADDNLTRHHNWMADGADFIMLSVALLIALFVWLAVSLSHEYSTFLNFNVEISTDIENRASSARSDGQMIIQARADGFYILRHRIIGDAPLKISVDKNHFVRSVQDTNRYSLAVSDIRTGLISVLSREITPDYIITDSLHFFLPFRTSKKVPVVPKYSISFAPQYMQTEEISLVPDSVVIFGDQTSLRGIESVRTENLYFRNVNSTLQGMVDVIPMEGVTISHPNILYSIEVERFVEEKVEIPVSVRNLPEDKDMVILPASVTLTYRHKYPSPSIIKTDDIRCTVDYDEYLKYSQPVIIPEVDNLPTEVLSAKISPRTVECLIKSERTL